MIRNWQKIFIVSERKPQILTIIKIFAQIFGHLFASSSTVAFVLHPNKPLGCNIEALLCASLESEKCNHIYILNFARIDPSVFEEEDYFKHPKITIINSHNFLMLIRCMLECPYFIVGDASDYNLPGKKVNVWHGVPLKNIGTFQSRKNKKFGKKFHKVISAQSKMDKTTMSVAFNLPIERVLDFGLPRHDWLMGTIKKPQRYLGSTQLIQSKLINRKLMLYAPTFRDEDRNGFPLSPEQLVQWAQVLERHNWVLGIRAHVASKPNIEQCQSNILNLSGDEVNHGEAVLECSDVLVTDYSSICIDFSLLDRPILGLDVSPEPYSRGFLLDFDTLFPGQFYRDFPAFLKKVEQVIVDERHRKMSSKAVMARKLFIGGYSGDASKKLVDFLFSDKAV